MLGTKECIMSMGSLPKDRKVCVQRFHYRVKYSTLVVTLRQCINMYVYFVIFSGLQMPRSLILQHRMNQQSGSRKPRFQLVTCPRIIKSLHN